MEDPSLHHVVHKRTRSGSARVSDFTLLVRVPDRPAALRVFTDDETDDARRYATETGGTVVPLPIPSPSGYDNDNLVPPPVPPPTCASMAENKQA